MHVSRRLIWPLAAALAVPVLATLSASAPATAAEANMPWAADDLAYPGAAQILADRGITLKAGDGHIVLADCSSGTGLVQLYSRSLTPSEACFKINGPVGYLALEIPQVYNIKGDDHAIKATLNTAGTVTSVDVNQNAWTPVGEGSSGDSTTLLELNATGTGIPAAHPGTTGTDPGLPGQPDQFTAAARINIGGKRVCSGALVDPSWVLTAASCFVDHPEQGINVPAGAPADRTTVTITPAVMRVPPLPSEFTVVDLVPRTDRDLVLAHLSAPVRSVAPLAVSAAAPSASETLRAGGYGRTATDWDHDQRHAGAVAVAAVQPTGFDITGSTDGLLCKGMAGGPDLRILGQYRWELAGIHSRSWQKGCSGSAGTNAGAYETRVDDLTSWLQANGVYAASGYTPVTSTRVMDTRTSGGRTWAAVAGQGGSEKVLNLGQDATGPFKLPQGANAVVLNVTVVNPTNAGFVAVEPNDKAKPTTSSVNFTAGQVVANLVTVPVAPDGKVYLWTNTNDFDAIVDVAGYYSPSSPNKYAPQTPVRLLDTRSAGGPLGGGATKDVQITGQNGVPADATAAVVTLTAVQSNGAGFLSAYAGGTTRPSTSNVNFTPGAVISNQAVVPIGAGGKITVFNSGGNTNAIVDLVGYYSPSATELFHPLSPSRLLDTRANNGAPIAFDRSVTIGDLPIGADAVVANATTVGSDGDGFFTLFADGTTRPTSSTLNFAAGQTLSVHATVAAAGGAIDLYNHAAHSHAIVDLTGFFAKP